MGGNHEKTWSWTSEYVVQLSRYPFSEVHDQVFS